MPASSVIFVRVVCASLVACALLAACQPPKPPALAGTGMDMFAPAALGIHHLSRILAAPATAPATAPNSAPAAAPALEVLIELTDQFRDSTGKGDTTKATGTFRLELFDQPPLTHKGPLLQSWMISVATPQEHQAYWDRITRTYKFRLALDSLPRNREHLLLAATLALPNGTALHDEYEVPVK
jgi:hypothetical protein